MTTDKTYLKQMHLATKCPQKELFTVLENLYLDYVSSDCVYWCLVFSISFTWLELSSLQMGHYVVKGKGHMIKVTLYTLQSLVNYKSPFSLKACESLKFCNQINDIKDRSTEVIWHNNCGLYWTYVPVNKLHYDLSGLVFS